VERLRAHLLFALFCAALIGKALLMRYLSLGSVGLVSGLAIDLLLLAGVLLVIDAFFADLRFKALFVVDAALSLFMLVLTVYSRFYGQLPTPEVISMAGQAMTVGESIGALLRPVYALFLIDLPLFVAVAFVWKWRTDGRVEGGTEIPWAFQHRAAYVLIVPALVAATFGITSVRHMPLPIDGIAASKARGVFPYLAASVLPRKDAAITTIDLRDPAVVQGTVDRLRGAHESTRIVDFKPGVAEGKNLIIIQVEALQRALIGAKIGGQEITPNLNRLVERSYYYPNAISQVGRGTTVDAEFVVNTSLYPAPRSASSIAYADRELPSLPKLFKAEGYDALTFHTNDATYWNRTQLYPALGFTRYYDKEFFGEQEVMAFGASDRVLLTKTLDELQKRFDEGTPFYAQIVTMSSHHPFTAVPENERRLQLAEPYAGTYTGDYLQTVEYADRQMGAFIEALEKAGMWDECMVVIYGDHFGLGDIEATGAEEAAQQALFGRDYTVFDRQNVPLIVHVPGQSEGEVFEDPVGQVDVLPTVADAFGLDLSEFPHFGRSAFEREGTLMPAGGYMPVGTYIDERVLYQPGVSFSDGSVRRIGDGAVVGIEQADQRKWKKMRTLLMLSDSYVLQLPPRQGFDPNAKVVLPDPVR